MSNPVYDMITVGRGLGGSVIGRRWRASSRPRTLEAIRDRVRGEGIGRGAVRERPDLVWMMRWKLRANRGRFACGLGPRRDLVATTLNRGFH